MYLAELTQFFKEKKVNLVSKMTFEQDDVWKHKIYDEFPVIFSSQSCVFYKVFKINFAKRMHLIDVLIYKTQPFISRIHFFHDKLR